MSTHSSIAVKNDDGSYEFIYCHWDGYPTGVGSTLKRFFSSEADARALIALGDCSEICRARTLEGVVAYHRDRAEPWKDSKPRTGLTLGEMMEYAGGNWVYVWEDDRWHVYDHHQENITDEIDW